MHTERFRTEPHVVNYMVGDVYDDSEVIMWSNDDDAIDDGW